MKISLSRQLFTANKISKNQAQYFSDTFKNSKHVDIVCHEATDRDSATSAFAMSDYLDRKGIENRIILSQNIDLLRLRNPEKYRIIQVGDIKTEEKPKDVVLCVDFSSTSRIENKITDYIQKANKILCLDHHKNPDIVDSSDTTFINRALKEGEEETKQISPVYVDSTSKSATNVIYRFFEALGEEIDNNTAYNLLYGFADDGAKRKYVNCIGTKGAILPTDKMPEDKNTEEIFYKLKEKLSDDEIAEIAKNIDIMSSLTNEEKDFLKRLHRNLHLSPKGKVAYVEIPPIDEQWENLGGDNTRTSAILNRFRQEILASDKEDKISAVITFYRAEDKYRMSIHAKENTLGDFYKLVTFKLECYDSLTTGGHGNRGGGKISSLDKDVCHAFTRDILDCADEIYTES